MKFVNVSETEQPVKPQGRSGGIRWVTSIIPLITIIPRIWTMKRSQEYPYVFYVLILANEKCCKVELKCQLTHIYCDKTLEHFELNPYNN